MGERVDRLVRLASGRVWVAPHMSVSRSGQPMKVDGYWRTGGKPGAVAAPSGKTVKPAAKPSGRGARLVKDAGLEGASPEALAAVEAWADEHGEEATAKKLKDFAARRKAPKSEAPKSEAPKSEKPAPASDKPEKPKSELTSAAQRFRDAPKLPNRNLTSKLVAAAVEDLKSRGEAIDEDSVRAEYDGAYESLRQQWDARAPGLSPATNPASFMRDIERVDEGDRRDAAVYDFLAGGKAGKRVAQRARTRRAATAFLAGDQEGTDGLAREAVQSRASQVHRMADSPFGPAVKWLASEPPTEDELVADYAMAWEAVRDANAKDFDEKADGPADQWMLDHFGLFSPSKNPDKVRKAVAASLREVAVPIATV